MSNPTIAPNVKYVLVIASPPEKTPENPGAIEKWSSFLGALQYSQMPPPNTLRIHNNVWMLPVDTGLPFLGNLMKESENAEIPMRLLFLEDIPDWIKFPLNAKRRL